MIGVTPALRLPLFFRLTWNHGLVGQWGWNLHSYSVSTFFSLSYVWSVSDFLLDYSACIHCWMPINSSCYLAWETALQHLLELNTICRIRNSVRESDHDQIIHIFFPRYIIIKSTEHCALIWGVFLKMMISFILLLVVNIFYLAVKQKVLYVKFL